MHAKGVSRAYEVEPGENLQSQPGSVLTVVSSTQNFSVWFGDSYNAQLAAETFERSGTVQFVDDRAQKYDDEFLRSMKIEPYNV